jgi:metal-dependent amidase/aminoacylase/carboxypeptidase family protein
MGGSADIEYKHGYPATINTEREAAFAARSAARIRQRNVFTDAEPTMGGEDFSFMLQAPGATYFSDRAADLTIASFTTRVTTSTTGHPASAGTCSADPGIPAPE